MQPILFKDSANREQKQQACLYVLPRCSLFYSKIVQIESKTKSSKLDFAVFPNRSIKVVKVLKILTLPPSKKQKRAETVASARLFCLQKRLFHDNFLNHIVGTHDVETCCHAGAGVGAYQCAGCCVDCHALCAVNNNLAVCSCDNHACYVYTCNA